MCEMEMPTPCLQCGETFDLTYGYESEIFHPGKTICESCNEQEQAEAEEQERWEEINIELYNALYGFREKHAWKNLSDDNRKELESLHTRITEDLE